MATTNLLEAYKTRLSVADKLYAQNNGGQTMSQARKLMTAKCLDNVSKFINEALDASVGTQRGDLGAYKKFTLNLVNVTMPNLIAPELVLVYPMSSFSGYRH